MNYTFLDSDWCGLSWTEFVPFRLWNRHLIPNSAGLYRVRVAGRSLLAYIGQTGLNLRNRLGRLQTCALQAEMPFNDPHTGAPRLWSYFDAEKYDFEASAALAELAQHDRLALECFLNWQYRLEVGDSTLCNFGRLHPRYAPPKNTSSGIRGRRMADHEPDSGGGASVAPLQKLGMPGTTDWMGLKWSEILPLKVKTAASLPRAPGVYLVIYESAVGYIGQSLSLANRLRDHAKANWASVPNFSYCALPKEYTSTQLLEVENDLIGGFYAEFEASPGFQFGRR